MSFDPAALRAFVRGQREAGRRAEAERTRSGPPTPSVAFARAMELWALDPDAFDRPRTNRELREIEQVRTTWARLRAAGWGQ